jgi:hypothetical protein
MGKHVSIIPGDGNGTPPGVRFSYQGILVVIAILGLVWPVALLVRTSDLAHIYDKIALAQAFAKENEVARKEDYTQLSLEITNLRNDVISLNLAVMAHHAAEAERDRILDERYKVTRR